MNVTNSVKWFCFTHYDLPFHDNTFFRMPSAVAQRTAQGQVWPGFTLIFLVAKNISASNKHWNPFIGVCQKTFCSCCVKCCFCAKIVSWSRVFRQKSWRYVRLHILMSGISLKILKEEASCPGTCKVVFWLRGCFDAIEKRYVRARLILFPLVAESYISSLWRPSEPKSKFAWNRVLSLDNHGVFLFYF